MARPPYHPKKYVWPLSVIASWRSAGKSSLDAAARPKKSRLQRRLKSQGARDRTSVNLRSRRHAQPSRSHQRFNQRLSQRLSQRSPARSSHSLRLRRSIAGAAIALMAGGLVWTHLFIQEQVTLAGVPYRIVSKFWTDKPARTAYFAGDRQALHGRLKALGIEADIKAYYRDRFPNEYELDKHIHQIMFDRTGYVGEAYQVDNFGKLNSIEY